MPFDESDLRREREMKVRSNERASSKDFSRSFGSPRFIKKHSFQEAYKKIE